MSKRLDRTGQRYGRLVALEYVPLSKWRCHCDCGNEAVVGNSGLRQGTTKSCGCLRREVTTNRMTTHKGTGTATYSIWREMKTRCENPRRQDYKRYGGRGITVCDRWQSFENFLADMGPRPPGLSIDRKDNSKGYEPGNCRWATTVEQARNTRANSLWEGKCIAEIAEELGVTGGAVSHRIKLFGTPYVTPYRTRPRRFKERIRTMYEGKTLKQAAANAGIPYVTAYWRLKQHGSIFPRVKSW